MNAHSDTFDDGGDLACLNEVQPETESGTMPDLAKQLLKQQMLKDMEEEARLYSPATTPINSHARQGQNNQQDAGDFSQGYRNNVLSCREYMAVVHDNATPLIGSEGDALLVRGEGLMIPGAGGVGKTKKLTSLACKLCTGDSFLKWQVQEPLRVLIFQAELPAAYFQKRLKPLIDSYRVADPKKADQIDANLFIADIKHPFDLSGEVGGYDELSQDIERLKIDVLIIDPFLSFYRGNENDNGEVRRALDSLKMGIAAKHHVGLIITDHMPKYSGSAKNPEQAQSMRGASAKRDWAASVIALEPMGTPDGQHGTFIRATVDKMRYGPVPRDPFSIRRDGFSFRHTWVKSTDVEPIEAARILDEAGGSLTKGAFNKAVTEALKIGYHEARKLIEAAIEAGMITTSVGERRATVHNLGDAYIKSRDEVHNEW